MTTANIAILGCTGSIGVQTLEIASRYPERLKVHGLAAGANHRALLAQVQSHRPERVVMADPGAAESLQGSLVAAGHGHTQVDTGPEALVSLARDPAVDIVVVAVVGAAGVVPTLEAVRAGKRVALANKEALVAAGGLITAEARRSGAEILPVDSEHSAIFQCMEGVEAGDLERLILTASGGPFRRTSAADMAAVTPAQALRHPNWDMGGKITIDSATLMNKGLEVLEAHWLFDVDYEKIDVVVHPQSIVHSLVELVDGSVLAQLGLPDMRLPIQHALLYPQRGGVPGSRLSLAAAGSLTFEEPDRDRFPCLDLAYRAGRTGGTLPAVMNAANEVAVDLFLQEQLSFIGIAPLIERVMDQHRVVADPELHDILTADSWARSAALELAGAGSATGPRYDTGPAAAGAGTR